MAWFSFGTSKQHVASDREHTKEVVPGEPCSRRRGLVRATLLDPMMLLEHVKKSIYREPSVEIQRCSNSKSIKI